MLTIPGSSARRYPASGEHQWGVESGLGRLVAVGAAARSTCGKGVRVGKEVGVFVPVRVGEAGGVDANPLSCVVWLQALKGPVRESASKIRTFFRKTIQEIITCLERFLHFTTNQASDPILDRDK